MFLQLNRSVHSRRAAWSGRGTLGMTGTQGFEFKAVSGHEVWGVSLGKRWGINERGRTEGLLF